MKFGYIKQIMRLQQQLCDRRLLPEYLMIPESVMKSNVKSPTETIFIAIYRSDLVGFSVVGVRPFVTIDPYDTTCYGKILRVLAEPRYSLYHDLFNKSEQYLRGQDAIRCEIIVINDGSVTERLCEEVVKSRHYHAKGNMISHKTRQPMIVYEKELMR